MTKINLIIEAGECNGLMKLDILDSNDTVLYKPEIKNGTNNIEIEVKIPCVLFLKVYGKNHNRDTLVDPATHKVVKDKYLKITDVYIDNKPLDKNKVQQMFVLESENNGKIHTSYWGFNGTVSFELLQEDSLELHLANML